MKSATLKQTKPGGFMAAAKVRCDALGIKLTSRRSQVLQALFNQKKPVSAYELVEALRVENEARVPVVTVYRVLDLFADAGIVHKIRSSNSYTVCAHLTCDHDHGAPRFLICERCQAVVEVDSGKKDTARMTREALQRGFHISDPQLEIYGLCERCASD